VSGALRLRHQLPVLSWLVLVWILLWGSFSWANLLSGILVAVLVTNVLPLPAVVGGVRVHPGALLVFLGYFVKDLVVSSAQVAWQAIRPSGMEQGAIIAVQLRTDSDLLLTLIAEALTLVPGSIVLDLDRPRRTLGIHLLHVDDRDDLEDQRAGVLTTEDRVVRAFGTAEDIARLDRQEQSEDLVAGPDGPEVRR